MRQRQDMFRHAAPFLHRTGRREAWQAPAAQISGRYPAAVLRVVHLEEPAQPEGVVARIPDLPSQSLFHVLYHVVQPLAATSLP